MEEILHQKRWLEKTWKNNRTITFNVLYSKKEKIYPAYISKHNSHCEKQIIFFNDSKWRMMALSCSKRLSALFRGITSKHHDDVYCLNCLHSFST